MKIKLVIALRCLVKEVYMFLNWIVSFVYSYKNWYKTFWYVSRNLSPERLRKEKHVKRSNEWKDMSRKTREEAVRVQRPSDPAEYSRLMKQSKCMISGISQDKLSSGAGLRYSLLPTLQPGAVLYTPQLLVTVLEQWPKLNSPTTSSTIFRL